MANACHFHSLPLPLPLPLPKKRNEFGSMERRKLGNGNGNGKGNEAADFCDTLILPAAEARAELHFSRRSANSITLRTLGLFVRKLSRCFGFSIRSACGTQLGV